MNNSHAVDDFYEENGSFRRANLSPVKSNISYKKLTEVAPSIWILDNQIEPDVCEEIISKFEASQAKAEGVCGAGQVQKHIKTSTDLMIPHNDDAWKKIDSILFRSLTKAKDELRSQLDKWTFFSESLFDYDTGYQIQKPRLEDAMSGTAKLKERIRETGLLSSLGT